MRWEKPRSAAPGTPEGSCCRFPGSQAGKLDQQCQGLPVEREAAVDSQGVQGGKTRPAVPRLPMGRESAADVSLGHPPWAHVPPTSTKLPQPTKKEGAGHKKGGGWQTAAAYAALLPVCKNQGCPVRLKSPNTTQHCSQEGGKGCGRQNGQPLFTASRC